MLFKAAAGVPPEKALSGMSTLLALPEMEVMAYAVSPPVVMSATPKVDMPLAVKSRCRYFIADASTAVVI